MEQVQLPQTVDNCTETAINTTELRKNDIIIQWNDEYAQTVLSNSLVMILFLVIGVVGNIIVFIIYSCRMKNTATGRYFIPILAAIDLIATSVSVTFNLIVNFRHYTFPGTMECKLLIYFTYVLSFSSLNMLLIIAVQRYLKVCHPFKKEMSLMWKRLSIGICVTFTALFHVPVLLFYGNVPVKHPLNDTYGFECNKLQDSGTSRDMKLYQPFDIAYNSGLVVVITTLYVFIGRRIYASTKLLKANLGCSLQGDITSTNIMKSSENSNTAHLVTTEEGQYIINELNTNEIVCENMNTNKSMESTSDMTKNKLIDITSKESSIYRDKDITIEETSDKYTKEENETDHDLAAKCKKKHTVRIQEPTRDGDLSEEASKHSNTIKRKQRSKLSKKVKGHFVIYRFSYMFMLISFLALVSYLPPTVLISKESRINDFWKNLSSTEFHVYLMLRRLYIFNHIVNPFIYGMFDKSFRREFIRLWCAIRRS